MYGRKIIQILSSKIIEHLVVITVLFLNLFAFAALSIGTILDIQSKAKEMVMLAEKMRQKLLSGSKPSATNDEEVGSKEEMQDWLLSVGIVSPVTKESAGALYHQQLSRQVLFFPHCVLLILVSLAYLYTKGVGKLRGWCFKV